MGRSAKLHKRAVVRAVKKTSAPGAREAEVVSATSAAKKKAVLKDKTAKRKPGAAGPVLGGADYVDIMMGGRRKAREAAEKLPREE
ncbi:hypothetical protein BV25DRAFT_1991984 [Artomyces pyxidatus]|uniref:Uncharacterized protein n=1 Tax=Artomyces pyxidatus TaxID=48021 RepID=A0ACB8SYU2_9AGAM|nr:hypothetical protein BV25DRAFT_1991984 [Artomyces pyxidatus]